MKIDARLRGDFRKGRVSVVAVKLVGVRPPPGDPVLDGLRGGQVEIQIAVVVVVRDGDAGSGRTQQVFFLVAARNGFRRNARRTRHVNERGGRGLALRGVRGTRNHERDNASQPRRAA